MLQRPDRGAADHDLAVLDHMSHQVLAEAIRDVSVVICVEHQQVRLLAGLDAPGASLDAERPRRIDRGGGQRLCDREVEKDHGEADGAGVLGRRDCKPDARVDHPASRGRRLARNEEDAARDEDGDGRRIGESGNALFGDMAEVVR
jgi:hypothetical protein